MSPASQLSHLITACRVLTWQPLMPRQTGEALCQLATRCMSWTRAASRCPMCTALVMPMVSHCCSLADLHDCHLQTLLLTAQAGARDLKTSTKVLKCLVRIASTGP